MATMVEELEERIKALVEAGENGPYVWQLRQQLADLKAQPDRVPRNEKVRSPVDVRKSDD